MISLLKKRYRNDTINDIINDKMIYENQFLSLYFHSRDYYDDVIVNLI